MATLPREIWIESVRQAPPDFHPRYDAIARTYTYRVGIDEQARSPFQRGQCWALCELLDAESLAAGAAHILGKHSFEAFAKSGQPERGYQCEVAKAAWTDWDLGVRFDITADRYLHHMVRYLVGTMIDIARHRRASEDIAALLSGQLLGIAETTLEMAVAFAKEREQFGRPIGGFQALKHLMADMFVRQEGARSAVYAAGARDPSGYVPRGYAKRLAKLIDGGADLVALRNSFRPTTALVGRAWELSGSLASSATTVS